MTKYKIIDVDLQDLNNDDDKSTASLALIQISVIVDVDGRKYSVLYQTGDAFDSGMININLRAENINGSQSNEEFDIETLDTNKIKKLANVQKLYDNYITANYEVDDTTGFDANSVNPMVARINKIKQARIDAGLTQHAMSDLLSIPCRTIADWDRGVRKPPKWAELLLVEKLQSLKK